MRCTTFLCYLALYFSVMLAAACPKPLPPAPPGPGPAGDAAMLDLFTGQMFDCTGLDTSTARHYAATCGDAGNAGPCMVMYVNQGVPAGLLACAARDVEAAAFIEVAKETASDATKARAATLRAWFRAEGMTLRSAP